MHTHHAFRPDVGPADPPAAREPASVVLTIGGDDEGRGGTPLDLGPDAAPPPFPDHLLRPAIEAAIRLWEPLAARAWGETAHRGRGLLALRWEELAEAAAAAADHPADTPLPDPPATWIPLTIVARGDDFRGLLKTYDPHRQVLLLVAHEDGAEAVFALETEGDRRPSPETCHARRVADASS